MGGILDRIWILLLAAVGLLVLAAAALVVIGVYVGSDKPILVKAPQKPAVIKPDAPEAGQPVEAQEESVRTPASPAVPGSKPTTGAQTPATSGDPEKRRGEFVADLKRQSNAVIAGNYDDQNGQFRFDVAASGGVYQPTIDIDMQLNARLILRQLWRGGHFSQGVQSVLVRYLSQDGNPLLSVAWSAETVASVAWQEISLPGLIDAGKLAQLKSAGVDMVRGYCAWEGDDAASFCESASRHKMLK